MNVLNRIVVGALPFVPRPIVRYYSGRYIAGETIEEAVQCVRQINKDGKLATLDVLGEDITREEEAVQAREQNIQVLHTIAKERISSNLSIKLTSLGLKLGKDFCTRNVREILRVAQQYGNFVRFDMEDSSCTSDTIEIFRHLQKEFDRIGIVLQAYMRRSEDDVRHLVATGTNFRLCKGIYRESPEVAFQKKDEIRRNFTRLLEIMLSAGCYVGIATHDGLLTSASAEIIRKLGLQNHQYEFQMLLGVQPELRQKLLRDGHRVRLYVPFGKQWYAYAMRRFKENPEVAGYVFKALFTRNV
jgi:proline dehydrogenase